MAERGDTRTRKGIIIKWKGVAKQAHFSGKMKPSGFNSIFIKMFGSGHQTPTRFYDMDQQELVELHELLGSVNNSEQVHRFVALSLEEAKQVAEKGYSAVFSRRANDRSIYFPGSFTGQVISQLQENEYGADALATPGKRVLFNTTDILKHSDLVKAYETLAFRQPYQIFYYRKVENEFSECIFLLNNGLLQCIIEPNENLSENIKRFLESSEGEFTVCNLEEDIGKDYHPCAEFQILLEEMRNQGLLTEEDQFLINKENNLRPGFIKYMVDDYKKDLIDLQQLS